jgi:hypothetical protein
MLAEMCVKVSVCLAEGFVLEKYAEKQRFFAVDLLFPWKKYNFGSCLAEKTFGSTSELVPTLTRTIKTVTHLINRISFNLSIQFRAKSWMIPA